MSKRTKFLLGIGVIAALVIGWQVAAFAVHDDGVFELEGNAVTDHAGAGLPDDWDRICKEATKDNTVPPDVTGPLCTSAGAASADDVAFVTEPNPNSSFFTGGGSKDPNDIPSWQWKDETGGLPDKANLQHSFAASYTGTTGDTAGDKLLYFGADRFDGSGDAAVGFWFFKNAITQTPPPPASSGTFTGTPEGDHENGDVLVISNFSNGGTVPTITVYEWDNTCTKADNNNPQAEDCAAANLRVVVTQGGGTPPTSADCTAPTDDRACAIVNSGTITLPWPFVNKSGTPNNQALKGEFFEGGINLTDLGLGNTCFATALAETRTSTSPTSTLKDFTIGKFGECTSGINTAPVLASDGTTPVPNPVTAGTAVKDSATITVTGLTSWTGNLKFFLCGPNDLDANGLCSTGGDAVGDPAGITVTNATTQPILSAAVTPSDGPGKYCFRGVFTSGTTGVPNSTDFDASECFNVADTYSIVTEQSFRPQDKATITTAGGTAVAGTVAFKLYDNLTNCQANGATGLLYEETVSNVSGPSPQTVNTSNDGVDDPGTTAKDGITITSPGGTLFWRVTFSPTNTSITGTNSVCVEDSSVTIDDTTAPPAGP